MSGHPDDDPDLLAAEYVLGVLDADAARAVEALAASDAAMAASIRDWQNRLAPLAYAVEPVTPPASLWDRIDQQTRPAVSPLRAVRAAPLAPPRPGPVARVWRSARLWRATTALSLAIAAGLAAFIILGRAPTPAGYVASLAPMNAPAPVFLARTEADGSVVVTALAQVDVAPGKDLELWALPEGARTPIPLGVLPARGRRVVLPDLPRAKTQLMVSLEAAGGSPSGLPTGPVLYAGTLSSLQ